MKVNAEMSLSHIVYVDMNLHQINFGETGLLLEA